MYNEMMQGTDSTTENTVKKFEFKFESIEKRLSLIAFIIFFLSLTTDMKTFWTIFLFAFSAVIFTYYFIWYRKKPAYVIIDDNSILINVPPFFKPNSIKKDKVAKTVVDAKRIVIEYNDESGSKTTSIYSSIISKDDWNKLAEIFKKTE